jgi:hypothetical protein
VLRLRLLGLFTATGGRVAGRYVTTTDGRVAYASLFTTADRLIAGAFFIFTTADWRIARNGIFIFLHLFSPL